MAHSGSATSGDLRREPRDERASPRPGLAPPLAAADVLHLAELVGVVRERLDVDSAFPDAAILASLQAIARRSDPRGRWRAAFDSNLGHWLALKGSDLNTALNTLVALMPRPVS
jgi:hypothetical protein